MAKNIMKHAVIAKSFVILAGLAMVSACGKSSSLTREQAIEKLTGYCKHLNAESYVKPTKVTMESSAANGSDVAKTLSVVDKTAAYVLSKEDDTSQEFIYRWAYVKDNAAYYATWRNKGGTVEKWYTKITEATDVETYKANIETNAEEIVSRAFTYTAIILGLVEQYRDIPEMREVYEDTYTSSAEGNLDMNVLTIKDFSGDGTVKGDKKLYRVENYLTTLIKYNKGTNSKETKFSYSANLEYPDLNDGTWDVMQES